MNRAIQRLAEEAGAMVFDNGAGKPGYGTLDFDVEEFADMLIKQCAMVIQDLVDHRVPASEYPNRLVAHFTNSKRGD